MYFWVINIYGMLNGFLFVYQTKNKLIIAGKNKKFIIPFYNRICAFEIIRKWHSYTNSIEPDFIDKKGDLVYNFSKTRKHRIKGADIVMYNTYMPEFLELNMLYLDTLKLSQGEIIFDLGAYCGLAACLFSKTIGKNGRVVSVEPDILNYYVLEKNIRDHELVNVKAINAVVWSRDTDIEVPHKDEKTYKLPAITPLELTRRLRLKRVDVVKMDIEGSEYHVFETIDEFIERYSPRFVIKVYHNKDGKIDLGYFYDIFSKHGYEMEIIKQPQKEKFPLIYAYK